MRATLLVIATLVAVSSFAFFAPEANAVGYCTSVTGDCDGWIVCIGEHTSNGVITSCQFGIEEPYCTCDPYPTPY